MKVTKIAKATITAVCAECGETFEVVKRNLRNLDAAEQYKEWVKDNIDICPECYKKCLREQRAAEAKEDIVNGAPELKGSEKQIAWAADIRHMLLKNFAEFKRKYSDKPGTVNMGKLVKILIDQETEARWWIDNRDIGGQTWARQLGRYMREKHPELMAEAVRCWEEERRQVNE